MAATKTTALIALLFVALVVLVAAPAKAEVTLDKRSAAAGSEVDVVVEATVEELNAYTDKLTVEVPAGFKVLACGQAEEFVCTQTTTAGRTVLTWQRSVPGPPVALRSDRFPFRMRTVDAPGKHTFVLVQRYSSGTEDRATPVLEVTPSASRAVTKAPPTTTPAPKPAVTAAPNRRVRAASVTPVTDPVWLADNDSLARDIQIGTESTRQSSGRMVLLGAIAAVAASGVFWLRRRAAPLA